MLDVTMTACRRPELIRVTWASFTKYLWSNVGRRLIINVDPVGHDIPSGQVITDAHLFFPRVVGNAPDKASFPKAFKWVLSRAETDIVLHLEDDWELTQKVDLSRMLQIMDENPNLACLRLAAFHAGEKAMKNWNKFFPYDKFKGFYPCPSELKASVGFCGHPSLIRLEFLDQTVPYLDIRKNPEKQFHRGHPKIMEAVQKWDFGVYSVPGSPPLIRDIGRQWMLKNDFKKAGSKAFFTVWEKT